MLFGSKPDGAVRARLLGARAYMTQFGVTVGFDASAAANAQTVTIVGDARAVDASVEAQLQNAGCRVERLNGDQYTVDAILADRVARQAEFG